MWSPWRSLRNLTHVELSWVDDLGPEIFGRCHHVPQRISMVTGLTQAQRRSTLAHELVHLERGPAAGGCQAREEAAVDHEAARRLISFDRLVDAMLWCRDDVELAEDLWVDADIVRARLHGLTDIESRELNRRLDEAEKHIP